MTSHRSITISLCVLASVLSFSGRGMAQQPSRGSSSYACPEPHPETMCTDSNMCGSATQPCTVDIKRSNDAASVTADVQTRKANAPFCVKVGTTVTWKSVSRDTGFVVDFGPASPFTPSGAIMGGSDRSPSVVASRAGCYKFSTGACVSGEIYGMCGSSDTELIIVGAKQ